MNAHGIQTNISGNLLVFLSKIPVLNRFLFKFSKRYIDVYRGYSYHFGRNGEKELLQKCALIFNKRILFFDVGANIGDWCSAAISFFHNYEGHLFEISTHTFGNLRARFVNNPCLYANKLALSDKNEEVQYKDYGENHGANTLLIQADYHKRAYSFHLVQCITGEKYCLKNQISTINLLKFDVEGTEMAVLKGFEGFLSGQLIDIIQFEYGYTHGDAYTLMRDFYVFLEGFGYKIGALRKEGVQFKEFSYAANDFNSGPNYVACLPKYVDQLRNF